MQTFNAETKGIIKTNHMAVQGCNQRIAELLVDRKTTEQVSGVNYLGSSIPMILMNADLKKNLGNMNGRTNRYFRKSMRVVIYNIVPKPYLKYSSEI